MKSKMVWLLVAIGLLAACAYPSTVAPANVSDAANNVPAAATVLPTELPIPTTLPVSEMAATAELPPTATTIPVVEGTATPELLQSSLPETLVFTNDALPSWFGGFQFYLPTHLGQLGFSDPETGPSVLWNEFLKIFAAQKQVSVESIQEQLDISQGQITIVIPEAQEITAGWTMPLAVPREHAIDLGKGIRFAINLEPVGSRIKTGQAISYSDKSIIWYSVGVDQDGMLVFTMDEKLLEEMLKDARSGTKLDSEQIKHYISMNTTFMYMKAMETLGHAATLDGPEPSMPGGCSNCGAFFDVVWHQLDEKGVFSPTIVAKDSFLIVGPDYRTTYKYQYLLFFLIPDANQ